MRALFDVNLLIALLDPVHMFSETAHAWWALNRRSGWASCPLTENGVVRVLSSESYSAKLKLSPTVVIAQLQHFTASTDHEFWPDSVSLREPDLIQRELIIGPGQVTDVYLLALATARGGRLVTLDRSIPRGAVCGATPKNLVVV